MHSIYIYSYNRGGAGISKVVRPLQIRDCSCTYTEEVGGGGGGGHGKREAWNARRRDERVEMITRNAYTQGKDELAWDACPNRLVLRLS